MKKWILLGALLLVLSAIAQVAPDPAEVALQAAMKKETVDGDLRSAIEQYKWIAQSPNRSAAAKAVLQMGKCYEKLGDPQARKAYERLLSQFADQKEAAQEARTRLEALPQPMLRLDALANPRSKSASPAGWYNGDWQPGRPGLSNWYASKSEFARVYDDFVVPAGGWTVIAVYSNSRMDPGKVTKASWEIRSGMSPGNGGRVVASGISPVTQTSIPGNGPFPVDPLIGYRIQVGDLRVELGPGRYWLSVAPCGKRRSYLSATMGKNAVGDPPGDNGMALFSSTLFKQHFVEAETVGRGGQMGIGKDFSQGVIIMSPSR